MHNGIEKIEIHKFSLSVLAQNAHCTVMKNGKSIKLLCFYATTVEMFHFICDMYFVCEKDQEAHKYPIDI